MTKSVCFQCQLPIEDVSALQVANSVCHVDCLRCCACGVKLQERCFVKNNRYYCRNDFHRLFGPKCHGCDRGIGCDELIRQIHSRFYHAACLVCDSCHCHIQTGEQLFIVDNNRFLCKRDFELYSQRDGDNVSVNALDVPEYSPSTRDSDDASTDNCTTEPTHAYTPTLQPSLPSFVHHSITPSVGGGTDNLSSSGLNTALVENQLQVVPSTVRHGSCGSDDTDCQHFDDLELNEQTVTTHLSPFSSVDLSLCIKKEESQDDHRNAACSVEKGCIQFTFATDKNDSPKTTSERKQVRHRSTLAGNRVSAERKEDVVWRRRGDSSTSESSLCSVHSSPTSVKSTVEEEDDLSLPGKRRGPRTTIKAKQLEILKSAFQTASKPARHTRERLALETGLNMRVIQVWFQNRRSKERRLRQVNALGHRRRHGTMTKLMAYSSEQLPSELPPGCLDWIPPNANAAAFPGIDSATRSYEVPPSLRHEAYSRELTMLSHMASFTGMPSFGDPPLTGYPDNSSW